MKHADLVRYIVQRESLVVLPIGIELWEWVPFVFVTGPPIDDRVGDITVDELAELIMDEDPDEERADGTTVWNWAPGHRIISSPGQLSYMLTEEHRAVQITRRDPLVVLPDGTAVWVWQLVTYILRLPDGSKRSSIDNYELTCRLTLLDPSETRDDGTTVWNWAPGHSLTRDPQGHYEYSVFERMRFLDTVDEEGTNRVERRRPKMSECRSAWLR